MNVAVNSAVSCSLKLPRNLFSFSNSLCHVSLTCTSPASASFRLKPNFVPSVRASAEVSSFDFSSYFFGNFKKVLKPF